MKNTQTQLKRKFLAVSVIAFLAFSVLPFINPNTAFAGPVALSCNSATLEGDVTTFGAPTQVWFEWGPGSSLSNSTPRQTFTSDGDFRATINSLNENSPYSYRAMASNRYGNATGDTFTFTTPQCQPVQNPTVNLTANPSSIQSGQSSTLSWTSQNATSCTLSQFGSVPTSGSRSVTPASTTTYNITCTGSNGQQAFDSATVNVSQNQPTVNLTASPSSIQSGQSSTLSWNSQNATSCTAYWTSSNATSGSATVFPNSTTTYSITCSNNSGSASDSATVNVSQNQPSVNLTADDTSIDSGDSTILRWTSQNATSCSGSGGTNGWAGSKTLSGTFNTGSLTSDRSYTITCSNSSGSANDSVTINVNDDNNDKPTVDIRADDTSIDSGDSTVVRWTSQNADSCRGTGGRNGWAGNRNTSGSFNTGSLDNTTTYKIICENRSGSAEDDDSVTVRVNDNNNNICQDINATNYRGSLPCRYPVQTCQDVNATNYRGALPCRYVVVNNQPTVIIYADSTNIAFNSATTIRWNTTNATSCFASGGSTGWAGTKSIGPGSFYTGSLTASRTYTITCSNDVGSATDSVTVNVRGQVLGVTTVRPPATSLVLVTSTVDRNRPIVPTLDNTNPCPGDDINYTITYQNIGTAAITSLVLRIDLPLEVDYISSNPSNPIRSGNTLIFNLGSLRANGQGTVTIKVHVRDNVSGGANLNFPAILSYIDPAGFPQSVSANVSAGVCSEPIVVANSDVSLGASVFGAGFLPTSIFGWLLLLILILVLILLAKYLFGQSFHKRTVTTFDAPLGRKTTTTTLQQ